VESVVGGRGNDRLAGTNRHNMLDGRRGHDYLIGRGGADELRGAGGLVSCGRGRDTYFGGRNRRDFLQPDCEFLAPEDDASISANPVAASFASVRLTCPMEYGGPEGEDLVVGRCHPLLLLRQARGKRRLVARGHLSAGVWEAHLVTARLTPLGRRLASRPRGLRVRVRLVGYYTTGPVLRWTIRLRVPR